MEATTFSRVSHYSVLNMNRTEQSDATTPTPSNAAIREMLNGGRYDDLVAQLNGKNIELDFTEPDPCNVTLSLDTTGVNTLVRLLTESPVNLTKLALGNLPSFTPIAQCLSGASKLVTLDISKMIESEASDPDDINKLLEFVGKLHVDSAFKELYVSTSIPMHDYLRLANINQWLAQNINNTYASPNQHKAVKFIDTTRKSPQIAFTTANRDVSAPRPKPSIQKELVDTFNLGGIQWKLDIRPQINELDLSGDDLLLTNIGVARLVDACSDFKVMSLTLGHMETLTPFLLMEPKYFPETLELRKTKVVLTTYEYVKDFRVDNLNEIPPSDIHIHALIGQIRQGVADGNLALKTLRIDASKIDANTFNQLESACKNAGVVLDVSPLAGQVKGETTNRT